MIKQNKAKAASVAADAISPTQEKLDKDYYPISRASFQHSTEEGAQDEVTFDETYSCKDDARMLREYGEWLRNDLHSATVVRTVTDMACEQMHKRHNTFAQELELCDIDVKLTPPPEQGSLLLGMLEDAQYAGIWQQLRSDMAEISKQATGGHKPLPEFESALLLDVTHGGTAGPPELIKGLLHRGEKMIFSGASKTGKSWAVADLALSIASGQPFWGMETNQAPVLVVNFELQPFFMNERLKAVGRAKGLHCGSWVHVGQSITTWNLRGHMADFERIVAELESRIKEYGPFGAIIFDPLYSALGDRNENDAGDMGNLMGLMESVSLSCDCAVVMIHHFAKGPAGMKASIDRGSGSGVLSRNPDGIITLDRHNDEEKGRVAEFTLRNFPPKGKMGLRFEHPLLVLDDELDTKRISGARCGAEKLATTSKLMELISPGQEMKSSELIAKAKKEFGYSADSPIYKMIADAVDAGWLEKPAKGVVVRLSDKPPTTEVNTEEEQL